MKVLRKLGKEKHEASKCHWILLPHAEPVVTLLQTDFVFMCHVVWWPHLLVQRGDGLNGGVQGIDVNSLLGVRVEVQQSRDQVLNEAQSLTCHIPGLKLDPQKNTQNTLSHKASWIVFMSLWTWLKLMLYKYTITGSIWLIFGLFSHSPGAADCVVEHWGCCSH